ncbi:MAG: hypothetical protein ACYTBW_03020 [Planctomycetota bacterium]|jgi:hypothetical protein
MKLNLISTLLFFCCVYGLVAGCSTSPQVVGEYSIHRVNSEGALLPVEENEVVEVFTKRMVKIDTFESADTNNAAEWETNELAIQVIEVDSTQLTGRVVYITDTSTDQSIYNYKRENLVEIDTSNIDFIRKKSQEDIIEDASKGKKPNKFGHYHNYPYKTPDFVSKTDDDQCGRVADRKAFAAASEVSETPSYYFGALGALFTLSRVSSKMNSTYEKEMKSCLKSKGYTISD